MKETPLSNCERDFLLKAIEEKKVSFYYKLTNGHILTSGNSLVFEQQSQNNITEFLKGEKVQKGCKRISKIRLYKICVAISA